MFHYSNIDRAIFWVVACVAAVEPNEIKEDGCKLWPIAEWNRNYSTQYGWNHLCPQCLYISQVLNLKVHFLVPVL